MAISSSSLSPLSLQLRGTLLVALSGMLYGFLGFLGTKIMAENFTVSNMLFWRFFIAMLWMLVSVTLTRKKVFVQTRNMTALLKIISLAAICYSGTSAFYFLASAYIGTGLAMVIFFAYPIFVALLAWLLSDWRMNKHALIALFAVIIGLVLLKDNDPDTLDLFGILFALLSAVFYAVYVYGSQNNVKMIDAKLLTLLICLGNTLIFFVCSYYTHSFVLPTTLNAWLYIIAIGIFATAIPIQLLLDGLKYISPLKASILSVLEPVVTVLVGCLLLHETMTYLQTLGVIIVLIGAIIIQFERKHSA